VWPVVSGRPLPLIGAVADLPNGRFWHWPVIRGSQRRPIAGAMERTGATVGATVVHQIRCDGAGVASR
jgi:hypothetical protein